jgi:hypothetical protein
MNETTSPAAASVAPRICIRPGCTRELGPTNKSGKCARDFHWNETPKARPIAGDSHPAGRSNGTNGHAPRVDEGAVSRVINGTRRKKTAVGIQIVAPAPAAGVSQFDEERLNRLILSLTIPEKSKIAAAWLNREI